MEFCDFFKNVSGHMWLKLYTCAYSRNDVIGHVIFTTRKRWRGSLKTPGFSAYLCCGELGSWATPAIALGICSILIGLLFILLGVFHDPRHRFRTIHAAFSSLICWGLPRPPPSFPCSKKLDPVKVKLFEIHILKQKSCIGSVSFLVFRRASKNTILGVKVLKFAVFNPILSKLV